MHSARTRVCPIAVAQPDQKKRRVSRERCEIAEDGGSGGGGGGGGGGVTALRGGQEDWREGAAGRTECTDEATGLQENGVVKGEGEGGGGSGAGNLGHRRNIEGRGGGEARESDEGRSTNSEVAANQGAVSYGSPGRQRKRSRQFDSATSSHQSDFVGASGGGGGVASSDASEPSNKRPRSSEGEQEFYGNRPEYFITDHFDEDDDTCTITMEDTSATAGSAGNGPNLSSPGGNGGPDGSNADGLQSRMGGRKGDAFFTGPCYLKFLVHNHIAGSIIGKGGSMVHQLTEETGCKIKLSPQNNFYPGTKEERPMAVSGTLKAIMVMVDKVLDKMKEQPYHAQDTRGLGGRVGDSDKLTFKIVAPNSACSPIIGTGGGPIQELQKNTDTKIQISNREEGLQERVASVTGTKENVKAAVHIITEKLQADEHLRSHMYVLYNNPNPALHKGQAQPAVGINPSLGYPQLGHPLNTYYGSANPGASAASFGMMLPGLKNSTIAALDTLMQSTCEVTMGIPESCAGAIIGRNMELGNKIAHDTGIYITISNKGDYIPGTTNRKLTLTGSVSRVHTCHLMIFQKVCEINGQPPPVSGPMGTVGFMVNGSRAGGVGGVAAPTGPSPACALNYPVPGALSPAGGAMLGGAAQSAVQQAVHSFGAAFQQDGGQYGGLGNQYHLPGSAGGAGGYGQQFQY